MLEHSRATTGERPLTDINQLAGEYLRLSYQGIKAKGNASSADYELIADENLPIVNVVPQEIGRVLRNLINNAFYAAIVVRTIRPYRKPKVCLSTQCATTSVEIRVTDNVEGIPAAIKDKIFQPFFTTKPTGEGTGPGLSWSYDQRPRRFD
ncbi:sensor histidine kinase [Runella slithyformis]|uniref:sensor histidine kinase n=1 Tax=Runella slithyformis TaxID=106 RepID=UPI000694CC68|nr:ATP-binding protein [Runella slithyformis]